MENIEDVAHQEFRQRALNQTRTKNSGTYSGWIRENAQSSGTVLDFGYANHSDSTSVIGGITAHEVICKSNKKVIAVDIRVNDSIHFKNSRYLHTNLLGLSRDLQINITGQVEMVFAGNIIEHLDNPGELFDLAKNILPQVGGGMLVITTVNPLWFIGLFDRFTNSYQSNCLDHTLLAGPQEMFELSHRHGFALKSWAYIGKDEMTKKFEPGGRVLGRSVGFVYRFLRRMSFPPSYNLVGFKFIKVASPEGSKNQ